MLTTQERSRNLAKARRVRQDNAVKAERERARQHKTAKRLYERAIAKHSQALREHGEGSPQERRAFRAEIAAECEWFRTHPGDRQVAA